MLTVSKNIVSVGEDYTLKWDRELGKQYLIDGALFKSRDYKKISAPEGNKTHTLTIVDNNGVETYETVNVVVVSKFMVECFDIVYISENDNPLIDVGVDGVFDPYSKNHKYKWFNGEELLSEEQKFSYNFSVGQHTLKVVVENDIGVIVEKEISLYHKTKPTPIITIEKPTIGIDGTIIASGIGSYAGVGGKYIETYHWFVNGEFLGNRKQFDTYALTSYGEHTLMLTVYDAFGVSNSVSTIVYVSDDVIPTPIITCPDFFIINDDIVLHGSDSYSEHSDILEYLWDICDDYGDVISMNGESIKYTPTKIGNNDIKLTIKNEDGFYNNVLKTVEVIDVPQIIVEDFFGDCGMQLMSNFNISADTNIISDRIIYWEYIHRGEKYIVSGDTVNMFLDVGVYDIDVYVVDTKHQIQSETKTIKATITTKF